MNKNLHRVVFNAARGMRMAVQETARSAGKAAGTTQAAALAVALSTLPVAGAARGQIAGAPDAPGQHRPQVLAAPNGVPLVNITTPSAAGVSRNVYSRFDVQAEGAILNNSRRATATQLGGHVPGNPWLARGSARIILNEISSGHPSQLRGYIEVGGQRAEVVIANPAGILIDGGGFINASRTTLTTGAPQLDAQGGLAGFTVRNGSVAIDGTGLDMGGSDYAAIYARAVSVNAGIWANELEVLTGANQVRIPDGSGVPIEGGGNAPLFALDVSHLGGMYANKIRLIGTEAGLGMRNAGTLQAAAGEAANKLAGAGELVVTSAGRLENSGAIEAMRDAAIGASSLANTGRIAAAIRLKIDTTGDLQNGDGGVLEARRVELASAAIIDNRDGTIRQSSGAALALDAPRLSNTRGGELGSERTDAGAGNGDLGDSSAGPDDGGPAPGEGPGEDGKDGAVPSDQGAPSGNNGPSPSEPPIGGATPSQPGTLRAGAAILNDGGRIHAGGPIALDTPQVDNTGGRLDVARLSVSGPGFSNAGGTLHVSQSFRADVDRFDNTSGRLSAGSFDITSTGDLLNRDGSLASNGDLRLVVGGALDNASGNISATGTLDADVGTAFDNNTGSVAANRDLRLTAGGLDNNDGSIRSAQSDSRIAVQRHLQNNGGHIAGTGALDLQAGSLANGGSLRSDGDARILVADVLSNEGSITAGRHLTLAAGSLHGGTDSVLGAGVDADGKLAATGDLSVSTAGALSTHGTHLAGGVIQMAGASIDLSESQTHGASIDLRADRGDIRTRGAEVIAAHRLRASALGSLDNEAGRLLAGKLDIEAVDLLNSGGQIVQTGDATGSLRIAGHLDNNAGRIASNGVNLQLITQRLSNEAGLIEHAGTGVLSIEAAELRGNDGALRGNGEARLRAGEIQHRNAQLDAARLDIVATRLDNSGGRITQSGSHEARIAVAGEMRNDGGKLQSNGDTALELGGLSNRGGLIGSTEHATLKIAVAGAIDNSEGALVGGGDARVEAPSLDNTQGILASGGELSVDVRGALNNQHGRVAANRNASIETLTLRNDGGELNAGGDLALQARGPIGNQGGSIAASGSLDLRSAELDNTAGQLVAGTKLDLQVDDALTNRGGLIAANDGTAVAAGSMDNSAGRIGTAAGDLRIDIKGHSNNTDGRLLAAGRLDIASGSFTNAHGTVSGDGLAVNVRGGALDNDAGKLLSGAGLHIASGTLRNRGGQIAADADLRISSAGLDNSAGRIDSLGALAIDAQGQDLKNDGGWILAQDDLRLSAGNAEIDNTSGLIRSQNDLSIEAGTFTNNETQGESQGIEAGNDIRLAAGSLHNRKGAIRAIGDAALILNEARNSGGLIAAGGTLDLADGSRQNLRLDNIGGQLVGVEGLKLGVGANLGSGPGSIASGGDIHLRGAGDWSNSDSIESTGSIRYEFAGTLSNRGSFSAGQTLAGQSRELINLAGAVMNGNAVDLVAQGSLVNHGTIDGEDTQVRGGSIVNSSRIYGTWLSVGGGSSVLNEAQGVIAGRNYLDLGAGSIVNRGELLSEGGMTIAGGLDESGIAIGKAGELRNESALISANGSMTLAAADIRNVDTHLRVERVSSDLPVRSVITVGGVVLPEGTEARVAGPAGTPAARYLDVKQADGTWLRMGPGYSIQVISMHVEEDQARDAKAARILAGGDITVDGRLSNRDSQVIAGGSFSANEPVINSPTQGTRKESGTSDILVIGTNPNQSGDHRFVVPIDNPETVIPLTASGVESGGGGSVDNRVPGGGTTPGGDGVNAPGIGGRGGGAITEVPSAVGGTPGVNGPSGLDGERAARSEAGAGPAGTDATARGPLVVRTATPSTQIPSSNLFNLRPDAGGHLIETDPRYADYRQWLASDYLLKQLGHDPNSVLKRLGDGYYEQRLIREQVGQLTGSRYLEGFNSDEAQYLALMEAGATFAQKHNLSPGVALSAEQMAQLTSDIVWLVEQTVTLADGSTQQVLVPQVYVRVRPGDIDGSGTLLSADKIRIKGGEGAGDVVNRGTIAGRSVVEITADNLRNIDGGRISGGNVQLQARQDIDNIGSVIDARQNLRLDAGRDVNVATTTATRQTAAAESTTRVDRLAGLYVTGGNGSLQVDAGRDIHLTGAEIVNRDRADPAAASGMTRLSAGRDLNLDTVTESSSRTDVLDGGYASNSKSREVGTTIASNGLMGLTAGRDINARQADIDSGSGPLIASAGRNINIVDGRATSSSDYDRQTTSKGRFSSTTTRITAQNDSSTSVGSSFEGGVVSMTAGNNINVVGSHISGKDGVAMVAGNEINILEGRDIEGGSSSFSRNKNNSLTGAKKENKTRTEDFSNTSAGSSIRSADGGVLIEAGNSVFVRGSEVEAGRDVAIKGGEVLIVAATDGASASVHSSSSRGGGLATPIKRKSQSADDIEATALSRSRISGENVRIEATTEHGGSGALTIAGTDISAPGKLRLEGESVELALQSTHSQVTHESSRNNLVWQSMTDSGVVSETLHYNRIDADALEVNASRVTVGMNARDSIEALSEQPGMEWVRQLASDPNLSGKIDWPRLEEAHKQWDYHKSGLTPEGAAIVTAAVAWATWGLASGAGAAAGNSVAVGVGEGVSLSAGGAFLTGTGLTVSSVVGGAVSAGLSALAGQAAVALINNKGDIGKTLSDLGSSSSVKSLVSAVVTGGVLGGLNLNPTGLPTVGAGAGEFMSQLGNNLVASAARAVVNTAIQGGSLEDALKQGLVNALVDTAAATGANWIGQNTDLGSFANFAAHAIAGCAAGAGRSGGNADGGCAAGAIGASLGEAAAIFYNSGRSPEDILLNGIRSDTTQFAAMVSAIGVAIAGGDATEIDLGANAGANAAGNNFSAAVIAGAARTCMSSPTCIALVGLTVSESAVSNRTAELVSQGMSERAAEAAALSEMIVEALSQQASKPGNSDSNEGRSNGPGSDTYGTPPNGQDDPPPGDDSKVSNEQDARALVRSRTETYGTSGRAFNVANEGELENLFNELTQRSQPGTAQGYNGVMRVLPDGTRIGMRNTSTTGGRTIDITPIRGKPYKIHISP